MTVRELLDLKLFEVVNEGERLEQDAGKVFCCDLLSIAMSRLPENGVWVTVMANINTLAVATLTEAALIVLAEGAALDEAGIAKVKAEGITVLSTEMPVFDAALVLHKEINA